MTHRGAEAVCSPRLRCPIPFHFRPMTTSTAPTAPAPARPPRPTAQPRAGVIARLSAPFRRWRLLAQLGADGPSAEAYRSQLVEHFGTGLLIPTPGGLSWVAVLDHLDAEDRQVSVRVRLMPHSRWHELLVRGGHRAPTVERPDPSAPLPRRRLGLVGGPSDLAVQYGFPTGVGLEQNLALFREYAGQEVARVRPASLQPGADSPRPGPA